MRADQQNAVRDRFGGLFKGAGARDWAEVDQPAGEVDLVRTGPGDGWPTFEEIMAQVPDGPAKEAVKGAAGDSAADADPGLLGGRRRVCPVVLVCPAEVEAGESWAPHKRAVPRCCCQAPGSVIEAFMWRAGLLPTPDEVEGEPWGRA